MSELYSTIAAIATPPGEGGIAIVRLSGPRALAVAEAVFTPVSGRRLSDMSGYTAALGEARANGKLLDRCIALVFRAPKSYTGEDLVELQCHGGEYVALSVLRALLDAGACPAGRGEFTRRALLNGRISLTEAEAVQQLVSSSGEQGARASLALMGGALYRRTESVKRSLTELQSGIVASIDFPEEVAEPNPAELREKLEDAAAELERLIDSYRAGAAVISGVPTAIAGSPNVGKSTLMNLLAGRAVAIVTPVAGTTRDVVEQRVNLGGTALLLADTAGLRATDDLVEQIGVSRALERIGTAALVLAVFDSSRALSADDLELIERLRGRPAVAVINKTDLERRLDFSLIEREFENTVYISALDPDSLSALDRAVARAVGCDRLDADSGIIANERQRAAAQTALTAVKDGLSALLGNETLDGLEVILDEALAALMELSGETLSETVLDEVFSRFCVGK